MLEDFKKSWKDGEKVREYKIGSMWEDYPWKISKDIEVMAEYSNVMCKHCKDYREEDLDGYTKRYFVFPFVVIATNEGGYNSTGVCLECILEAVTNPQSNINIPEMKPIPTTMVTNCSGITYFLLPNK